jgi:hypothetical protein
MMSAQRKLTEREQTIMDQVRTQCYEHYQAVRKHLQEEIGRARHMVEKLIATAPDAAVAIEAAQRNLQLAENRLADVSVDEDLDMQELAFLAGQQDGFLSGIQFAVRAISKGEELPVHLENRSDQGAPYNRAP